MIRWKRLLAWAGFAAAVLAIVLDRPVVTWAAISLLGLAFALKLALSIRARRTASGRDSLSEPRDES
jgi:uncharacterized membrane protein